jgi:hypothetical protein
MLMLTLLFMDIFGVVVVWLDGEVTRIEWPPQRFCLSP